MPAVTIGTATIPYRVRRSARARRLRLVVTPGRVEVVAPERIKEQRIVTFVESRRHWLYEKTKALRERTLVPVPERFVNGAKVLFRGRFLRVRVEPAEIRQARLRYATGFQIQLPRKLAADQQEKIARRLVISWLKNRALEDAVVITRRYSPKLGAAPAALRIGSQKTLWGSCSARGVISLNWRLMAAPRTIFEYVVVHELCHLVEPNHGARFWRLVGRLLPDYGERRAWLKKHGVALG